jgi:hypothetical protein
MPELHEALTALAGEPLGIDAAAVRARGDRRRRVRRTGLALTGAAGAAAIVAVGWTALGHDDPQGLDIVGPPAEASTTLTTSPATTTPPDPTVPTSSGTRPPVPIGDGWGQLPAGPVDGRTFASHVWTGEELIVWGGEGESDVDLLDTGAAYDPTTGAWRELPPSPLAPRAGHVAVWTGDEMIICCGGGDPAGGIGSYDPASDTWTAREPQSELESVRYAVAVWTGQRMVVAGGGAVGSNDVAIRYDPVADTWEGTAELSPSRLDVNASVAWTGTEMIVVPGVFSDEPPVAYDPVADTWRQYPPLPDELEIQGASGVWTGSELILWGVSQQPDTDGMHRAIGARFDETTGAWAPIADADLGPIDWYEGTPGSQQLVWDAERERMIVLTGSVHGGPWNGAAPVLAYHPADDRWEELPAGPGGFHPPVTIVGDLLVVGGGERFWALDLAAH